MEWENQEEGETHCHQELVGRFIKRVLQYSHDAEAEGRPIPNTVL